MHLIRSPIQSTQACSNIHGQELGSTSFDNSSDEDTGNDYTLKQEMP